MPACRRLSRLITVACALLAYGCELAPASERDSRSEHEPQRMLRFETLDLACDGAATQPVTLQLPPHADLVTIRVSSVEPVEPQLAFTLEDVRVAGDESWVEAATIEDFAEFCTHCRERVSTGMGYGLFNLPSTSRALRPIREISLRVALRDSTTWLPVPADFAIPATVRVEWLGRMAPAEQARLHLNLGVAVASEQGFPHGAADPLLRSALERLTLIWRQAGVEVDVVDPVALDAPGKLSFSPGDRSTWIDLTRRARLELPEAAALLLLTPCITVDDPLARTQVALQARTPHLPGGLGVGQEPDGMFVAAERCTGSRALPAYAATESAVLGAIMAHELGHFFGLYHVRELDETTDQLPDTSAAEPNLMQARPDSTALQLTPEQVRVARRHPALTTER